MFLDEPTTELRQGDLCSSLVVPYLNLNDYLVAKPHDSSDGQVRAVVQTVAKGRALDFVVCSHDCDLENVKSGASGGVAVAPILPAPFDAGTDEAAALSSSHSPDVESNEFDFINLFPLELPSGELVTVDYSLITTIGPQKSVRKQLLALKRAEMTETARDRFAFKLAAFFGRRSS